MRSTSCSASGPAAGWSPHRPGLGPGRPSPRRSEKAARAERDKAAREASRYPRGEPLEPSLRRVLDLVESGEPVDAIGRETGLGPGRARAALGRLELMGLIGRDGFAGYFRALGAPPLGRPILDDLVSGDVPNLTVNDHRPACVISIAGSDSGGGAGIQADLKAFARCGVHGTTALTAITAQNTLGVRAVHAVPPEMILAQVAAVAEDIGVDAVKIGMLGTVESIEAVDRALDLVEPAPVVLDPVMVAESGASLLDEDAAAALRDRLLPRATVVTPNVMEAGVLAATAVRPEDATAPELAALARAVHALGPGTVVVTGGHAAETTDVVFDGEVLERVSGELYPRGASHGSGCTHSSALAAHLALGLTPLAAARRAKEIAAEAVRDGLSAVGQGPGPVNSLGVGIGHGRLVVAD